MTEYLFHMLPSGTTRTMPASIALQADSHFHGAALALRQFMERGCDITAPLAHIDITESNGVKQTLLVDEVAELLNEPTQVEFVDRENLGVLLQALRAWFSGS